MIREPTVAGVFYADDPAILKSVVGTYVGMASTVDCRVKAIIAPHAGYVYSGPVAASAYTALQNLRGVVTRVVLAGPSHHVPFRGVALTNATAYRTPLGHVPVDRAACDLLMPLPQVQILHEAHIPEHSLEVQLPFLQSVLGAFSLVPLVVGEISPVDMAEIFKAVWGGDETLIVVSSDLSHYLEYQEARLRDAHTEKEILALNPANIGPYDACGCRPVGGLLVAAKDLELKVATADLRNSGDTYGSKDRVVGYGAWVFY